MADTEKKLELPMKRSLAERQQEMRQRVGCTTEPDTLVESEKISSKKLSMKREIRYLIYAVRKENKELEHRYHNLRSAINDAKRLLCYCRRDAEHHHNSYQRYKAIPVSCKPMVGYHQWQIGDNAPVLSIGCQSWDVGDCYCHLDTDHNVINSRRVAVRLEGKEFWVYVPSCAWGLGRSYGPEIIDFLEHITGRKLVQDIPIFSEQFNRYNYFSPECCGMIAVQIGSRTWYCWRDLISQSKLQRLQLHHLKQCPTCRKVIRTDWRGTYDTDGCFIRHFSHNERTRAEKFCDKKAGTKVWEWAATRVFYWKNFCSHRCWAVQASKFIKMKERELQWLRMGKRQLKMARSVIRDRLEVQNLRAKESVPATTSQI